MCRASPGPSVDSKKSCVSKEEKELVKKARFDDTSTNALVMYDALSYYSWYARSLSAFRPWSTLSQLPSPKDVKQQNLLKESVPAYLSHGPPILLNPERVVPSCQSEQFERSFQPNVALAPQSQKLPSKSETNCVSITSVTKVISSPVAKDDSTQDTPSDTEESTSKISSDFDSNCSAIKQVTAVLDELNDVKEVTRQRVISLVEQLAIRLDRVEAENKLLKEQLRAKAFEADAFPKVVLMEEKKEKPPSPSEEKENRCNSSEVVEENGKVSSPDSDSGKLRSSPVSVITSSPTPVTSPQIPIKTEPKW